MEYGWHDFFGNVGVVMVLFAYLLLQLGKLPLDSLPYLLLNAAGSILIMVSLFYDFNLSSFIIELAWLAISLFSLWRLLGSRGPEAH
jgi:hypothetical protein